MAKPTGRITRGKTGVNRLRRVDRWIAAQPAARAPGALVVDLGYGASATTSLELHERLARGNPGVEVLGLEIDPARVALATAELALAREAGPTRYGRAIAPDARVSFALGGFEVPAPRAPRVIRAMNVLRQYDEHEVAGHWATMRARLAPGGLLVEGTSNELGRVCAWVALDATGPRSLTIALKVDELGTEHELPLLGLRSDTTYDVTVTVTAEDGSTATASVEVVVPPLSILVPDVSLRAGSAADAEPGYTLMAAWAPSVANRLLAVDHEGNVVWAYETRGDPKSAMLWPDGRLSSVVAKNLSVRTMAGASLALYSDDPIKGAIALPDELHHDAYFPGDGTFWSLRNAPVSVTEYPVDEFTPYDLAPATLLEDRVVHFDETGVLLGEWSMAALLDTTRIGFGSLDMIGSAGLDWTHGNAVWPVDGGASFVVSLRHQDALVKVNAASSEVEWILANPDGWPTDLDALRLAPVGDLDWPYHAHGVKVDGDMLYVFDNGNDFRTTPYSQSPHPDGLFSRIVGYRIDEKARTVEQVVDLVATADGTLFSRALGNVQLLPTTGHLLGTYSYLVREHGVSNQDIGRGLNSTRLLEWDPSTESVVWDLSISGQAVDTDQGWLVDRATRVPSLYLGIAEESWR